MIKQSPCNTQHIRKSYRAKSASVWGKWTEVVSRSGGGEQSLVFKFIDILWIMFMGINSAGLGVLKTVQWETC